MKIKSVLILLCASLSLGTASLAGAASSQSLHYEATLKSTSFGNMGTRKMWIKGDNMRWEAKSGRLPLCVIKNKQGTFLIHPWNKIAAKYQDNSLRSNPIAYLPGPAGSPSAFLKSVKAKQTGMETIKKQKCKVYAYKEPSTYSNCKLWVDAKTGKPVKLLVKGANSKQDTFTATYTQFVQGAKVQNTLFELPKDYKIRPMPTRKLTSTSDKSNSGKRG